MVFTIPGMLLLRWNKEGRTLNLRWKNFRKFITDFSSLEQHPPESVTIWENYMAYAVGLGVGEQAIKAMKKVNPEFVKEMGEVGFIATSSGVACIAPRYLSSGGRSTGGGGGSGGWSGGFSGSGGGFGGGGVGAR